MSFLIESKLVQTAGKHKCVLFSAMLAASAVLGACKPDQKQDYINFSQTEQQADTLPNLPSQLPQIKSYCNENPLPNNFHREPSSKEATNKAKDNFLSAIFLLLSHPTQDVQEAGQELLQYQKEFEAGNTSNLLWIDQGLLEDIPASITTDWRKSNFIVLSTKWWARTNQNQLRFAAGCLFENVLIHKYSNSINFPEDEGLKQRRGQMAQNRAFIAFPPPSAASR